MPRLSNQGNIGMGIGGHQGSINGNAIPDSRGPYWFNDSTVVWINTSDYGVVVYNLSDGSRGLVSNVPVNFLAAGGNVWASWGAGHGFQTSTGIHLPQAGLQTVGPDGAIAYTVQYNGPDLSVNVIELSGEQWKLTNTAPAQVQLLGQKRAVMRGFDFNIYSVNVPPCTKVPGSIWDISAVELNGQWWITYQSETYGIVCHPFDSTYGYIVQPQTAHEFNTVSVRFGNNIRVAWSITSGEGPDHYRFYDVDLNNPRQQIVQEDPIVVIGKACWLGWFEYTNDLAYQPPGNSYLWIKKNGIITRRDGIQFAQWVQIDPQNPATHNVEYIESVCQASPYPCVAYWDKRDWPRWPNLKSTDWINQFGYCMANESMRQFEINLRGLLNKIPPQYSRISITTQCYTSNTGNTTDLKGVVPVYSKIARDYSRVNFLLSFTDQGRATGLVDHRDVEPYWQRLYNGITGTPQEPTMDTGIVDGVLVNPEAWWFNVITAGEDPANYMEVLERKAPEIYKWGIGQQINLSGEERGRLFMPWSECPNAAPRNEEELRLGVNQTPSCCGIGGVRCKEVDVVNNPPTRWIWHDRNPGIPYQPIPAPNGGPDPVPGNVHIEVYRYTNPAKRSDLVGLSIDFEAASDRPITEIRFEINDGDKPFIWKWVDGKDGRYFRQIGYKATVNGDWIAKITAIDDQGNFTIKEFPLTVTF